MNLNNVSSIAPGRFRSYLAATTNKLESSRATLRKLREESTSLLVPAAIAGGSAITGYALGYMAGRWSKAGKPTLIPALAAGAAGLATAGAGALLGSKVVITAGAAVFTGAVTSATTIAGMEKGLKDANAAAEATTGKAAA